MCSVTLQNHCIGKLTFLLSKAQALCGALHSVFIKTSLSPSWLVLEVASAEGKTSADAEDSQGGAGSLSSPVSALGPHQNGLYLT